MEKFIDNQSEKPQVNFIFPDVESEIGEIERVARKFAPGDESNFTHQFIERAKTGQLVDLAEDLWQKLENTDSSDIPKDGWDQVDHHVSHENANTGAKRSWQILKAELDKGTQLQAPMIAKVGDTLHLVSGNTRLMTSRAYGIIPKVLIVEI